MSNFRMPTMLVAALMILVLVGVGCTRAASTPPAGEGPATAPLDSQQATMEAVRAALLTQTAEAQQMAPLPTEIPTDLSPTEEPTAVPPPEETQEPVVEGDFIEYIVKQGDWVFKIAQSFGVDPQAIVDLNQLTSPSQVVPGLVLKIPPTASATSTPVTAPTAASGRVHVVKPGEWIWQIARLYGIEAQALLDANDLGPTSVIYPGMELIIP